MFWIVIASQLSPPLPANSPVPGVPAYFSSDDMPAYIQAQGINRFVATKTTVGPDGMPQDCTQNPSSGDQKLDVYTCSLILKRARFQPARWTDGSPAFGVIRIPVTWVIGMAPSKSDLRKAYPADMKIFVSRLPAGAGRRTDVSLMIAVEENGRVVGCSEWRPLPELDRAKTFPELVPIACQQLTNQFTAIPARNASGKPVRSVQSAAVEFATKK